MGLKSFDSDHSDSEHLIGTAGKGAIAVGCCVEFVGIASVKALQPVGHSGCR